MNKIRSGNLGMRELDMVIGSWTKNNAHTLSLEECE